MKEKNETLPSLLVVDDSVFLRKRLRQSLRDENYELVEADNGLSALEALDHRDFDCILTDLVMPCMDGFQLLAEIQKRQIAAPVVVITADVQQSTRDRCKQLGAAALLQKPINPEALRALLSGMVGGR